MQKFNNFDTVTYQPESEKYWFFKEEECWSKAYGNHNVKYEGSISNSFSGVPSYLDAVVTTSSKYWFFKGANCWSKKFGNHEVKDEGSISSQFSGVPSNLDDACYVKGKYWFFKGANCWSKKYGKHDVKDEGSISSQFSGIPSNIDGFTCVQGKYWFFKGTECWSKEYGNHEVVNEGEIRDNFSYIPVVDNPKSWMQDSLEIIGDKCLWEISLPATHDSGMSSSHNGTAGAFECNTQTQSKNVLEQLEAGTRYFDIRPIIGSGKYYTGHYSNTPVGWQGARGESIDDIIEGVNDFTNNQKELVILSLSHAYDTDSGYKDFSKAQWESLLDKMRNEINCLFVTESNLLNEVTINEYIESKAAVLIIVPSSVDYSLEEGVYSSNQFSIGGKYSNTNALDIMRKDQLGKMKIESSNKNQLFKLSWTLTQDATQASTCFISGASIEKLAGSANGKLDDVIKAITSENYPNIISVDYFPSEALSVAVYSNEYRTVNEKENTFA